MVDANYRTAVAITLREHRNRKALTQVQLAKLCGVGSKTISSFESGQRTEAISLEQLLALLDGLNVSPQAFFNDVDFNHQAWATARRRPQPESHRFDTRRIP